MMSGQAVRQERAPGIPVGELNRFAAAGLVNMVDPNTGLFCHRFCRTAGGYMREGVSARYTAITLLGLNRWKAAGGDTPIATDAPMDCLLNERAWLDNVGDIGLMLWLIAQAGRGDADRLYSSLDTERAWDSMKESASRRTMEIAWFLTGLSYIADSLSRSAANSAMNLAHAAYELLVSSQGDRGFFGHQNAEDGLRGFIRGSIGSFADQVYPIYALTQYAIASRNQEPLRQARRCADAICASQGPFGEWWWHYDAIRGKVFQRYPVYSVHQDGMAPMALWKLGEATGHDFSGSIHRGLAWIYGANELGADMRDSSTGMIWRSVYGTGIARRRRDALDLLGKPMHSTADLRVLHECRPYHQGWLLYAFAGRD
jgi:hypothetical protein